jgi:peptide/nickel transport system substrate-binding protein
MTKRVLQLALALLLASGIGTAAAQKDTLTLAVQGEPPVLDPLSNAAAVINSIVAGNIIESLTRIEGDGTVVPGLAESWAISPDGKTYRFTLHRGVLFHDGTKLDSGAVKYSFERAMAPDSVNPTKKLFEPIAKVEAPDPDTVVIELKSPYSLFLFNVGQGPTGIVHPGIVESNKTKPVGTGPYRFQEWAKGNRVVLVRNEQHRNAAKVAIRQVTFRFIDDPSAGAAALLSGDIDAYTNFPAPEALEAFKRDPRFKVVVGTTEGEVPLILNNKKPPLSDIRVRRAINHAIDRQAIIDGAMSGFGTPIGSHFPPHNPAYVDLTKLYPHDIGKAKQLLAEAGFPDGIDLTLKPPPFPYARRSAEIVAQQLGEANIRVKIEPVEWAQWLDIVYKQANYDMTIVAHAQPWDLDNYARGPKYYYGYDNPEFNALVRKIRTETDPARWTDLLRQAQRKIAEDAVHAFLFQLPKIGVYAEGLEGYWPNSPVPNTDLAAFRWR